MLPSSLPSLMVGVNRVIMLSLNMVIIASVIGAGRLGCHVLTSLKRLDIGTGLEAGVAIVVLAIALYGLIQAFALRPPPEYDSEQPNGLLARHPSLAITLGVIPLTSAAGLALPALQR